MEPGAPDPAARPDPPTPTEPPAAETPQTPPPSEPAGQAQPTGPIISWAPPSAPVQTEVPGAPGLVFADTTSRFVAIVVDYVLIGIVAGIVAGLLGYGRTVRTETSTTTTVTGTPLTVAVILLGLVYFVWFWTGGRRATLGQRLLGIQVGNAFDGQPLTIEQALSRWLALGSWVGIFSLAAALAPLAGLVQIVWSLALLATTITSPTKQGLHDRFAHTAVVRPAGSTSSLASACLVIVLILIVLGILGIVLLLASQGSIEQILSQVGNSV